MKRRLKKKKAVSAVVVGTGLLALDVVVGAENSAQAKFWAGGTCGNVLTALSYLGWAAKPIARLDTSSASDIVVSDLRRWRVSKEFIRVEPSGSTPIIVERITKNSAGLPKHSFSWRCSGCGAPFPGYKPELLSVTGEIATRVSGVKVFFFDRVSAGAIQLAQAFAKANAVVVFEPSGIGNPILFRKAWEIAHVIKYSHERLSDLSEMEVAGSPRLIVETLGEAGLRYKLRSATAEGDHWVEVKSFSVMNLKDAAGAGDWCTAGIIAKLAPRGLKQFLSASDKDVYSAIRYGQALATWNCGFEGPRGGMYSVTKAQFKQQVDEILSGTQHSFESKVAEQRTRRLESVLCRACELSGSINSTRKSS